MNTLPYYIMTCPHCRDYVVIFKNELNCKIFRHAMYKDSYRQVSPHLSKEECDKLISEGKVYGCCKPFRWVNEHTLEDCGYI